MPSFGTATHNLTRPRNARTAPRVALPNEQDLPMWGSTSRAADLRWKTPVYLCFAEEKAVQGKKPPPPRCAGGPWGHRSPSQ